MFVATTTLLRRTRGDNSLRGIVDRVNVTLEIWAGLPHVFQNSFETLDEADAALDRAARFLADRLGAPTR